MSGFGDKITMQDEMAVELRCAHGWKVNCCPHGCSDDAVAVQEALDLAYEAQQAAKEEDTQDNGRATEKA